MDARGKNSGGYTHTRPGKPKVQTLGVDRTERDGKVLIIVQSDARVPGTRSRKFATLSRQPCQTRSLTFSILFSFFTFPFRHYGVSTLAGTARGVFVGRTFRDTEEHCGVFVRRESNHPGLGSFSFELERN